MTVGLPIIEVPRVSHSNLLLTAWTLAVAIVENSNDILIANEISGRGSSFPEVEKLAAFVVTAIPLCVGIHSGTIREHAALVQSHTIEAMAIQHTINWDEQLVSQMETSAYWVLINDEDGYEEPTTEALHLQRTRAEKIGLGMWPFHLTFNVHPGNTSVELQALFNTDMVGVDKALRLYACFKFLVGSIFAPGGLDLKTTELVSAVNKLFQGNGSIMEEVKAVSSIESWFPGPGYNPYS
ncbi:hypothetical protein BDV39DRAFT_199038 [Aspergillus sergii]|uniref:Uncharacterized protein n=1 Tax=Aspergillus sergii TaxID=1034303 RepID=A0A5N6XNY6_9EURO|nr:hypothetical protein BDV39DRAFT_199038 [Aspergillus sergii]